MKLSEAIRLGAMATRPGYNGLMNPDGPRCALAAAADACGLPADYSETLQSLRVPYVALRERFPILRSSVELPVHPGGAWHMSDAVWTLNDSHGWSRERIADWVESIERAQEKPTDAEGVRDAKHAAAAVGALAQ